MTLFEQILDEAFSVIYGPPSEKKINNAINNRNSAIIRYRTKGKNEHTQQRTIFPVAYGINKKGNQVVRAYQTGGDTTTVKPGWKFFRVDRILSWYNMRNTKFDMRMLVNLGYNRDGDKLMTKLFNNVKTKAKNQKEFDQKKVERQDKITSDQQPVITSKPISKGEVSNQSIPNPQSTGNDALNMQSLANNIDNNQIEMYNDSDNQTAMLTAPETIPVTKKQVNATYVKKSDNEPSKFDDSNNNDLTIDDNNPIVKADIENNPISEAFNDMMRRFDLLDKKNNKKEIL